jgi:hypothetical protein
MKTTMFLQILCVIVLLAVPTPLAQPQNRSIKTQERENLDYKVWRIVSFTDERGRYWLGFVSVEPALFNSDGMSRLYKELSSRP